MTIIRNTSVSILALGAVLAAVPAQAQEVRARLGHVFAIGSPVDRASENFATCVGERTDGAIEITVFPNSQLGGDEALGRDLSRGGLEFAFLNPGSLTGLDPLMDIHYLPYIVSSFEEADKVFYNPDGILQTTLRETMADRGMHAFGFFELEFRAVTNSVRPVETLDDMQGLKLRVPGSASIRGFFDATGAQTVTMPFPELFVALQQGTVDGQDNGASITYNSRLFEAQPHMTLTNHVYAMGAVTAGQRFWDGLPEAQKTAIQQCSDEATAQQIKDNRALNGEFLANIEEGGTAVVTLSDAEMARFVEVGRSLWSELEDVYGAERIEALRAEVGQ
ncbi:TRAP transporter substrate-binding protein [Meridianimarinicoccus sp. RP-17]|uniref:TRAP transporter substrate-binding protein n=1 Tax=Meridianimarinicoccus zhengii TaxID=2056810 RepID=UPI000DAC0D4E|nr:TRAP transporter substrate-binding protein [Phycocomes zhengii]